MLNEAKFLNRHKEFMVLLEGVHGEERQPTVFDIYKCIIVKEETPLAHLKRGQGYLNFGQKTQWV